MFDAIPKQIEDSIATKLAKVFFDSAFLETLSHGVFNGVAKFLNDIRIVTARDAVHLNVDIADKLVARKRDGGTGNSETLSAKLNAVVENVLRSVANRKAVDVNDTALNGIADPDAIPIEFEGFAVLKNEDVLFGNAGCDCEVGMSAQML